MMVASLAQLIAKGIDFAASGVLRRTPRILVASRGIALGAELSDCALEIIALALSLRAHRLELVQRRRHLAARAIELCAGAVEVGLYRVALAPDRRQLCFEAATERVPACALG